MCNFYTSLIRKNRFIERKIGGNRESGKNKCSKC